MAETLLLQNLLLLLHTVKQWHVAIVHFRAIVHLDAVLLLSALRFRGAAGHELSASGTDPIPCIRTKRRNIQGRVNSHINDTTVMQLTATHQRLPLRAQADTAILTLLPCVIAQLHGDLLLSTPCGEQVHRKAHFSQEIIPRDEVLIIDFNPNVLVVQGGNRHGRHEVELRRQGLPTCFGLQHVCAAADLDIGVRCALPKETHIHRQQVDGIPNGHAQNAFRCRACNRKNVRVHHLEAHEFGSNHSAGKLTLENVDDAAVDGAHIQHIAANPREG
mmetsp:Transcript_2516/g.5849  ORF Transcript_2516/g.5849 Transcript_2516/m.5849 type:complete len:275 (-) Transcript_2516:782-1606(-)